MLNTSPLNTMLRTTMRLVSSNVANQISALTERAVVPLPSRNRVRLQRNIFTIIHQGHEGWRLSLGRNPTKLEPGLRVALPLFHTVQEVDLRETSVNIQDLTGFTSDNVPVSLSGSLFYRVKNSYDACFSVHGFRGNVEKIGTSAMRSVMGSFAYDEVIGDRNKINLKLHEVIGKTIEKWGVECTRFEIQSFKPSNREVERQLELQMEAERNRRKQLLDTQAQVNIAEGMKQKAILASEGAFQAQLNEAAGEKQRRILESEGNLEAARNEGRALAEQIGIIAEALAAADGSSKGVVSEIYRMKALDAIIELRRLEKLQAIAKGNGNSTYFFGETGGDGNAYQADNHEKWKRSLIERTLPSN